jgi:hypothetical protein
MFIPHNCTLDISPAPSYCVPGTPFTFSGEGKVRIPVLTASEVVVIAIRIIGETTAAGGHSVPGSLLSRCRVVAVIKERTDAFILKRFPLIDDTYPLLVNTDNHLKVSGSVVPPDWVKILVNALNTDTQFCVLLSNTTRQKGPYDFRISFQDKTCIKIPHTDPKSFLFND